MHDVGVDGNLNRMAQNRPSGGAPRGTPPPPGSSLDDDESSEKTRKVWVQRVGPDKKLVTPALRVVAGRDMLRFVTLQPGDVVSIGRDESGSLVLSDASVSRRHARVTCNTDGTVNVQDLGSTNGTAVNGLPVERALLRPGDHLEIGAVSLRLDLLSYEELAHLDNVLARLRAANRDPLTGLLTRAFLEDELPEMLARASTHRQDFTCIFLDVDQFKSVNDRYGHAVGDDVLMGVARLVLLGVRDGDPCVRYGGEEVAMFLLGTKETAGAEVADRTRRAIQGHDWTRTAAELRVTASFGVAQWDGRESWKDWLRRADKALYQAKANGRNRIVRAAELP